MRANRMGDGEEITTGGEATRKVALVTGGTAGVGLSVARLLAGAGAKVIVNGRSPAGGDKALTTLAAVAADCEFLPGDATNFASMADVVESCLERHGHLDILVSAGGEGGPGPMAFAEMSPAEIVSSFQTRLLARLFPVRAALPALRRSRGSIVMLTTDAGRHATPGEVMMGAVGAAVISATKGLARELARDGVRINSVALTITSGTPSWDRIFARESFESDLFSKAVARFPFGRPPTADEVAQIAAFLALDQAGQVTGQTISVNGGLSFGGW
jgi:3-oxoacyl-[acyl-carrier protein] reductase